MSKYIDADQAIEEIRQPYLRGFTSDDFAFGFKSGIENAVNTIKQMPAADVAEVRYGRWRNDGMGDRSCSLCGTHAPFMTYGGNWYSNYCPNCGALMGNEE